MHLDNGKGSLIVKNVFLEDSLILGQLTAVKHGNGRDWWIIAKEDETNRFFRWLLTSDAILGPFVQNISPVWNNNHGGLQSYFNHRGDVYAIARWDSRKVELYDFDRCLGSMSNHKTLNVQNVFTGGMGICFSPNDTFLYVSTGAYLYQYDMFAVDIDASKMLVGIWDSTWTPYPTSFSYMLAAPDHKIYIGNGIGYNVMNVINYPDSAGLACNVVQHPFPFPTLGILTPPNFPDYSLGAKTGSQCDSLTYIVENKFSDSSYSLIPNPSNDKATLKYCIDGAGALTLIVTDMTGRTEMQNKLSTNSGHEDLDVHDLKGGMYYFSIISDKKLLLKGKFAVMH
ncbi:MAG: T9SS type A sorting domain-containing protein, partial [Bacteroidota bacterium]